MLFGALFLLTLFAYQSNVKDVVRLIARMVWCTKVMDWLHVYAYSQRTTGALALRPISKKMSHVQ
jgi:hypothetical protein